MRRRYMTREPPPKVDGPLYTDHLRDLDNELKVLKRKREMFQEEQQRLEMMSRRQYDNKQSFNTYSNEAPYYQSNIANYANAYGSGNPNTRPQTTKRQFNPVWENQNPSPPKRFTAPQRINPWQTQNEFRPQNQNPNRSQSFNISAPPRPLLDIRPGIGQRIRNNYVPPNNRKDFKPNKVTKPTPKPVQRQGFRMAASAETKKLIEEANKLIAQTNKTITRNISPNVQSRPENVQSPVQNVQSPESNEEKPPQRGPRIKKSPKPVPKTAKKRFENDNILLPYKQPTVQMKGRLELALGMIVKSIRDLCPSLGTLNFFMLPFIQRVVKHTLRTRIRNVMMNEPIESVAVIIERYRMKYPKDTDSELMKVAIDAHEYNSKNRRVLQLIESDDPEDFFRKNLTKLLQPKLEELFANVQKLYENKPYDVDECLEYFPSVTDASKDTSKENEDSESDVNKETTNPKDSTFTECSVDIRNIVEQLDEKSFKCQKYAEFIEKTIEQRLPRLLPKFRDELIAILITDKEFLGMKAFIVNEMKQRMRKDMESGDVITIEEDEEEVTASEVFTYVTPIENSEVATPEATLSATATTSTQKAAISTAPDAPAKSTTPAISAATDAASKTSTETVASTTAAPSASPKTPASTPATIAKSTPPTTSASSKRPASAPSTSATIAKSTPPTTSASPKTPATAPTKTPASIATSTPVTNASPKTPPASKPSTTATSTAPATTETSTGATSTTSTAPPVSIKSTSDTTNTSTASAPSATPTETSTSATSKTVAVSTPSATKTAPTVTSATSTAPTTAKPVTPATPAKNIPSTPKTAASQNIQYVKLIGRPHLPARATIYDFLNQFNPTSIKKHKSFNNLLVVGFTDNDNYEKILNASESVIGDITIIIKASEQVSTPAQKTNEQKTKAPTQTKPNEQVNTTEQSKDDKQTASAEKQSVGQKTSEQVDTTEKGKDDKPPGSAEKQSVAQKTNEQVKPSVQSKGGKAPANAEKESVAQKTSEQIKPPVQSKEDKPPANTEKQLATQKTNEQVETPAQNDKDKPDNNGELDTSTDEIISSDLDSQISDLLLSIRKSDEDDIDKMDTTESTNEKSDEAVALEEKSASDNSNTTTKDLETIMEVEEEITKPAKPVEATKASSKESGRATPTRSSSRLANVTPSTIKTRRSSRLAND